jgi:hypothetical protein
MNLTKLDARQLARSVARIERITRASKVTRVARKWQIVEQEWKVFNNTVTGLVRPVRIPIQKRGEEVWVEVCKKMLVEYNCEDGTIDRMVITKTDRKNSGVRYCIRHKEFNKRYSEGRDGELIHVERADWVEDSMSPREFADRLNMIGDPATRRLVLVSFQEPELARQVSYLAGAEVA